MKIFSLPLEDSADEILSVDELSSLGASNSKEVLTLLTTKIANLMQTDVCSLYLIHPLSGELILEATHGLNPEAVGKVRMKVGEGLVGKTIEWLKPISLARGQQSRGFKYFPQTGEEQYSSFLSLPLVYKKKAIGVLVVQNRKATRFSERSVRFLMTLAMSALKIVEKEKFYEIFAHLRESTPKDLNAPALKASPNTIWKGIAASPGIAIGILRQKTSQMPQWGGGEHRERVGRPEDEIFKFKGALLQVRTDTADLRKKAETRFGMEEVAIFEAYQMLLEGDFLQKEVFKEIETGASAIRAIESVITRLTSELSRSSDDYIKERAYDIQDVGRKLTDALLVGALGAGDVALKEPAILYADYWSISDFVDMNPEMVKGILSSSGGATSHVAILAESLGIPAVLGLNDFNKNDVGGEIVMDGNSGLVIVRPDAPTLKAYRQEMAWLSGRDDEYRDFVGKKVHPLGGHSLSIGANMGMIAHATQAMEIGVDEIGLYRTEFPFLIRKSLPTEEDQCELYKKVLQVLSPKTATIRTLDIGGDKYIPYLNLPAEANPFLGWRSIRFSLDRDDLFRIQIRALLKASAFGRLKILFPMISSVEEFHRARQLVEEIREELTRQNVPMAPKIPLGAMIEVPAAVEIIDLLAKEADFFSVGTNDLIQYLLAVDRNNPKVAHLYTPYHPAVLRALHRIVTAAHRHDKPVSVCGEMASDILSVCILLGMGFDGLSLNTPQILKMKSFIGKLKQEELEKLVSRLLKLDTAQKVHKALVEFVKGSGLESYLPHVVI